LAALQPSRIVLDATDPGNTTGERLYTRVSARTQVSCVKKRRQWRKSTRALTSWQPKTDDRADVGKFQKFPPGRRGGHGRAVAVWIVSSRGRRLQSLSRHRA